MTNGREQFAIKPEATFDSHKTSFDFQSIMMYGATYFGIDEKVTISSLKLDAHIGELSNKTELSLTDRIELGRVYTDPAAPDRCFTMKNLREYAEERDRQIQDLGFGVPTGHAYDVVTGAYVATACDDLKYDTVCSIDFTNTLDLVPGVEHETACQAECRDLPGCTHFTFVTSTGQGPNTSCALLRSCDDNMISSCSALPGCTSAVSGSADPAIVQSCCTQFGQRACRGDLLGEDFNTTSPEACQALCQGKQGCRYFTQIGDSLCKLFSTCPTLDLCSLCTAGPVRPSMDQCTPSEGQETLLLGGWTNVESNYAKSIELITTSSSCLPNMPDLPIGRQHSAAVLMGNTLLYCGGQMTEAPTHSSRCMTYQLGASGAAWEEAPAMNHPRYYFSLEAYKGKAYAIGGHSDWGHSPTGHTVEVYTPGQGWNIDPHMRMSTSRHTHCSVLMDSRLIVIGGHVNGNPWRHEVNQFDLDTPEKGWTTLTSTHYGRTYHACTTETFDNQYGIFVSGGSNSGHTLVEFYVDAINLWRKLPPMKRSRYHHGLSVVSGQLMAHGGQGGEPNQDSFNQTWTVAGNLQRSRKYHATVSIPAGMMTCK